MNPKCLHCGKEGSVFCNSACYRAYDLEQSMILRSKVRKMMAERQRFTLNALQGGYLGLEHMRKYIERYNYDVDVDITTPSYLFTPL